MKFCAIAVFIFLSFVVYGADTRQKIAVMEIEDKAGVLHLEIIDNATEMLRSKLTAAGNYIVIDKSRQMAQLREIIKAEKKESYKECYDRQCQIPLGQALSADTILRASVSCINNTCVFSVEMVDLAKEAAVRGGSAQFIYAQEQPESLLSAIDAVVMQLTAVKKEPEKEHEKLPQLPKKRSVTRPYFWYGAGLIGLGVLTFTGGMIYNSKAADSYDSYNTFASEENIAQAVKQGEERDAYIQSTKEFMDKGDYYAANRNICYITGALLSASGGFLLWWTKETEVTTAFIPLPGGALLSYAVNF